MIFHAQFVKYMRFRFILWIVSTMVTNNQQFINMTYYNYFMAVYIQVTRFLYNLIEFYCYLLSIRLDYTTSSILYKEASLSRADFVLTQKGTNDLFIDELRSIVLNKRLQICNLMKNPITLCCNSGSLSKIPSSQFRFISQSFQANSCSLCILHRINIFKISILNNSYNFRKHLPDVLDDGLKIFSSFLQSFSQNEFDWPVILAMNIFRGNIDYGILKTINQRCFRCMLILFQTFQRYLELLDGNRLLYSYLANYENVHFRLLCGMHSNIPSESIYTINYGLFSDHFYSKSSSVCIFTVSNSTIEFCPFSCFQRSLYNTVFYISAYSIFLLLFTNIVQHNCKEDSLSNCCQLSLLSFVVPCRQNFIFRPVSSLSFISNVVRDGLLYCDCSFEKCLQLKYDLQVIESPDGLIFNLII